MEEMAGRKEADVGFASIYSETPEHLRKELEQFKKPFVAMDASITKNKYLLDVEGTKCSFSSHSKAIHFLIESRI